MQYPTHEPFPAHPQQDDSPIAIVSLWRLLWRNKLRIALPTILFAALAAVLVVRSEDTYAAEAQVLLTRGSLEIVEFDSAGSFNVEPGAINNAMTIMGSRNLALQVINRLDLTQDPQINPNLSQGESGGDDTAYTDTEVRQLALDWLESATQINAVPGSNVISILVVTPDPDTSAAVANAYAEAYLDYQRSLGRNETERAAEALERRVNELRLQLEVDQEALQAFRGSSQSVTQRTADASADEAAAIRSRLETIEAELTDIAALLDRLDSASADRLDGLRSLIDDSQTLSALERSALGRKLALDSLDTDVAAMRRVVEVEKARLEQLRGTLEERRARLEPSIDKANAFLARLRQLEVDLETTSQVYAASLARLKELSIQTGLRDAGAQVLVTAEPPLKPSSQGRMRNVVIVSVLGFFIGAAYVLLREAANDRVRRALDVAVISGPETVVPIPSVGKGFLRRRRTQVRRATQVATGPFYEGIRTLRQQLISASSKGGEPFTAGVFSALPNEGKTTVADALARSLALIGKRVIVVDADMRTGTLSLSLGIAPDAPGLKTVVTGADRLDDAVVSLQETGYDLLPSGFSDANPADLLESTHFADVVGELRRRYDVVLFDTPPILVVPDARRISAQIDRHVFVASFDQSPRPAVREALTTLQDAGCNRLVVALCNIPESMGHHFWLSRSEYARYVG